MRFSSKERMQEVVLKTVFKISEHQMSQSDLLRNVTNLLNDLDKVFLFKNTEHNEREDIEQRNIEAQFKDNYFLAKMIKKSIVTDQFELMEHYIIQKLFSIYVYLSRQVYMRIKILQEYHVVFLDDNKTRKIEFCESKPQSIENYKTALHLLIERKHNLLKLVQQRQYLMAILRYHSIYQAIHLLHFSKEIQETFFKGMSLLNQKMFIKGYFRLKEEEVISLLDVDYEIQSLLSTESKPKAVKECIFVKGYQLTSYKPAIEKLNRKAEKIRNDTLQKVKVLGEKTGHVKIREGISNEACCALMQDFENHHIIKKPLLEHLKLTKEQSMAIRMEISELDDIDKQILRIENRMHLEDIPEVTLSQHLSEKAQSDAIDIQLREKHLSDKYDLDDLEATLNDLNLTKLSFSNNA